MILLLLACAGASEDRVAGSCEASALLWDGQGFVVADNEQDDRLLRFGPDWAARAPQMLPEPIEDIEALAQAPGGGLVVVGSHSVNKKGAPQPERRRIGRYTDGAWVFVEPDLGGFGPALNIEGAALWQGAVWLGLRGPLSDDKAQLLRMSEDLSRVTETRLVDLGGLGIRALSPQGDNLLVIAGPVEDGGQAHSLWRMPPVGPPRRLEPTLPASAEGLAIGGDGRLYIVIDGDGKGEPCAVPSRRQVLPAP